MQKLLNNIQAFIDKYDAIIGWLPEVALILLATFTLHWLEKKISNKFLERAKFENNVILDN